MLITRERRIRPSLIGLLLVALMVLLSGAAYGQAPWRDGADASPVPPGLLARNIRAEGRIAATLPVLNADSIEVSGSWTLPGGGGGQWGPIQSLQVCALGGAMASATPLTGNNGASVCRDLSPTTSATAIRLPFDLSDLGDQTGSVWKVRMCVTTRRHQQDGPQVCADHEFPLDAPPPDAVTGLQVTSRVLRAGNE